MSKPNREPSIHITVDLLSKLIPKYFLSVDNTLTESEILRHTKMLAEEARKYALDHRVVISDNKELTQKLDKVTKGNIGDANLLSTVIYSCRVKMKHIGVTKIKQTDQQWPQVKELVPIVNEFCEKYDLEYRQGYIKFVETGLKLMANSKKANFNYCASWMSQRVDWILSMYDANYSIQHDDYPEYTLQICNIYSDTIASKTGVIENYIKNPLEYVHFYRARLLADGIGCDYDIFIEAQFAALEFCNGIPRIEDLHSDKARQRVIGYLAKNNIVIDQKDTLKGFNWSKLKN